MDFTNKRIRIQTPHSKLVLIEMGLDEDKLYIKECYANEGITMKRWMPRAKGSASPIMKRTSHITVVVDER